MNNDRIYEHATNAGAYCETYLHGGDPKPPVLDNMDLIKFAQLIINDCAKIADSSRDQPSFPSFLIKQHFGIK